MVNTLTAHTLVAANRSSREQSDITLVGEHTGTACAGGRSSFPTL